MSRIKGSKLTNEHKLNISKGIKKDWHKFHTIESINKGAEKLKIPQEKRTCICGCNQSFICKISDKKIYIKGHYWIGKSSGMTGKKHNKSTILKMKNSKIEAHKNGKYTEQTRSKISKAFKDKTYLQILGSEDKVIKRKNKLIDSLEGRKSHIYKKGWYLSAFGEKFYYESSYEKTRMEQLDNNKIKWTKRHNILIPYKCDGKIKHTRPDFLIETNPKSIEEVKGRMTEKEILKINATRKWCLKNGYSYRVLQFNDIYGGDKNGKM